MKDLSLSLLSRGCGRWVPSKRNPGRQHGRLDVCFTPQDYYIWKSKESLLHLSNSGHLLAEAESTLPKTYSTRRGPLLLYSQDLVTVETNCRTEAVDRKKRVVRRHAQQAGQQLSALKELTAAIMSCSKNQCTSSRLAPPLFPPLHFPPVPDLHCPSPLPIRPRQPHPSPELLIPLNPEWLHAEENCAEQLGNQAEDEEEQPCSRNRVRLDLFLQIPCSSRSPTPQTEPQPWLHYVAMTPEEHEEPQNYLDTGLQPTESSQHTEVNHHSMRGDLRHPSFNCARDVADDRGCFVQRNSGIIGDKSKLERSKSGTRHGRTVILCGAEQQQNTDLDTNTTSGLLFPQLKVGQSACYRPCWEKTEKVRQQLQGQARRESLDSDEHTAQCLPPIAESRPVSPGRLIQDQTRQDPRRRAGGDGLQFGEKLSRLHQQPLFLPLLFPEREEPPPPVGVLGCVAGRKGPGKQSSLTFPQNQLPDPQDPWEPGGANRGVVRGIIPLELRDFQNGKSVGSLILGPDGEIIRLSLYNNRQDPSEGDAGEKQQALQVLSTEGEKLPWVVVLQTESMHTGAAEVDPDVLMGNIQAHQPQHKLLGLHSSKETNACSPTNADTEAEAATETWKKPKKKEGKNNARMPEQVGKEEPRGGNSKVEEEEEEEEEDKEELATTGQTSHLSGSQPTGQENKRPTEATTEETVDRSRSRRNIKRKDAEDAALNTGKRNMKIAKTSESDAHKTSRTSKDRKWPRQKVDGGSQPIRGQKQEITTNREAAETKDQTALPSGENKTRERERERGKVRRNKETGEQGGEEAGEKEVSARRRRRSGRRKHKELVVGHHEEKGEVEEESHLNSTGRPQTTQKHGDAEANNISTSDKHGSGRPESSLRSRSNQRSSRRSAASPCEGMGPASGVGLTSVHGRLSSCSTVMVTDEQLVLNPVNQESSKPDKSGEEEAEALRLARRAERRRQEVERKRREREEEERKQREREQTEERMKGELEEERRKRAEELRLKKLAEEEERRGREEEELERARREQAQRERERRRQEERRRQMERFQRAREEEEQRRKAELERLQLEEQRRQEEESRRLREMEDSERTEYLRQKEQEEEDRRNQEEECRRREEEAALLAAEEVRLQAELFTREMALLQQQLAFNRGLVLEAGGLEQTQGISRPWVYSYFALLQLLGPNPSKAETKT